MPYFLDLDKTKVGEFVRSTGRVARKGLAKARQVQANVSKFRENYERFETERLRKQNERLRAQVEGRRVGVVGNSELARLRAENRELRKKQYDKMFSFGEVDKLFGKPEKKNVLDDGLW